LVPGSNPGGPNPFQISDFRLKISFRGAAQRARVALEIAIFSALILAARCANYQDVFVAGNVYFTDADCYARMTRVRMCEKNPGLIIRHHEFENFPRGTTPHTTAPLDYLILALALTLRAFSNHALDLSGAIISPLLGLIGGWFLWWWSRRMQFRFRIAMLLLYAISPILVHGTELGRPDHQSLLILLVMIAICAEWRLQTVTSTKWSILSGLAWGISLWVSFYEPLILLLVVVVGYAICDRQQFSRRERRIGWLVLALIVLVSFLIEQRLPRFPILARDAFLTNWSRTVGELGSVSPIDRIWFRWVGWLLIGAPFLAWLVVRKRTLFDGATGPVRQAQSRLCAFTFFALLGVSYFLSIWQARWAYFFAVLFVIATPGFLTVIKPRVLAWTLVLVSIFPILQDWDERLWPNESELALRLQTRLEAVQRRGLAVEIRSKKMEAFLAPWWLSPAIAYWSAQPAMAGSSHESLAGIVDSARFFLASDFKEAREILEKHGVVWIFAYDADRVLENSRAIVNKVSGQTRVVLLDRNPSRAPSFLQLKMQNGAGKLYRVNYFP
jgi:hypothetical protein